MLLHDARGPDVHVSRSHARAYEPKKNLHFREIIAQAAGDEHGMHRLGHIGRVSAVVVGRLDVLTLNKRQPRLELTLIEPKEGDQPPVPEHVPSNHLQRMATARLSKTENVKIPVELMNKQHIFLKFEPSVIFQTPWSLSRLFNVI